MQTIINADDYGKDENATKAILDSFRKGFITQTTLMVNMPWTEQAVEMAKAAGYADRIGLHVNLTEGMPLTAEMKSDRRFCDQNGMFMKNGIYTRKWLPYGKVEGQIVGNELEAQINRFLSFGLPLRHCDGHHHAHLVLPIFNELAPLLKRYGFTSVRKPADCPWERLVHPRVLGWTKGLLMRFLYPSGIKKAHSFGSYEYYLNHVASVRNVMEIMVHPRYNKEGRLVDFKSEDGRPMQDIADRMAKDGNQLVTCMEAAL